MVWFLSGHRFGSGYRDGGSAGATYVHRFGVECINAMVVLVQVGGSLAPVGVNCRIMLIRLSSGVVNVRRAAKLRINYKLRTSLSISPTKLDHLPIWWLTA